MPRTLQLREEFSNGPDGSSTNNFHKVAPMEEKQRPSWLRRTGKLVAKAMLGITLATTPVIATGLATSGCDTQQQNQNQVTNTAGQTDTNGNAAFNSNGWVFNIHVYDSVNLKPIPGLVVLLFANGGHADYIILDPNNMYPPALGGATGVQSNQTSGSLTQAVDTGPSDTNVLLTQPTMPLCGASVGGKLYSDVIDFLLHNDLLKGIIFDKKNSSVKLSDLDDIMKQLSDLAKGEVGGEAAKSGVVMALAKAKVAQGTTEAISGDIDALGYVALGLTICADSESQAYANYYHSLCYDDNATFTVYGLNGVQQLSDFFNNLPIVNLLAGFDSPFYIIEPDAKSNNASPPYATVNAKTYVPSGDANKPWRTIYDAAGIDSYEVDKVDKKLVPLFAAGYVSDSDTFKLILNACSNFNPVYTITAPLSPQHIIPDPNLTYKQATSDPLPVTDKDDYGLDFYLQTAGDFVTTCPNGYQTYYKPDSGMTNDRGGMHHDIAVACTAPAGYQPYMMTGLPANCKEEMELTDLTNDQDLSIYGDYVRSWNGDQTVNYVNMKTGDTGSLQPSQSGLRIHDVSNISENKFIFGGRFGSNDPVYLFDLDTKTQTKLPFYNFDGLSINQGHILALTTYTDPNSPTVVPNIYDLKGNLIESLPDPPMIPHSGFTRYFSFFGSRVMESRIDAVGQMFLHESGSQTWNELPPSGWWAILNGDNIAFRTDSGMSPPATFGIYNIPNSKQTTLSGGNTYLMKYSYSGDNLALLHDDNSLTGPGTVSILNVTSGAIQPAMQAGDMQKIRSIDLYNNELALDFSDMAQGKRFVVVCSF